MRPRARGVLRELHVHLAYLGINFCRVLPLEKCSCIKIAPIILIIITMYFLPFPDLSDFEAGPNLTRTYALNPSAFDLPLITSVTLTPVIHL